MNILTDKVFVPVVEHGNLIVHSFTALIKLLLKMVMSTANKGKFQWIRPDDFLQLCHCYHDFSYLSSHLHTCHFYLDCLSCDLHFTQQLISCYIWCVEAKKRNPVQYSLDIHVKCSNCHLLLYFGAVCIQLVR